MNIFVDIDETICEGGSPSDYSIAKPKSHIISQINVLYDTGNRITYWTARGAISGIDWRNVTEQQLNTWGAKYHELRMDKPPFDLFIDDKCWQSDSNLFNKLEKLIQQDEK